MTVPAGTKQGWNVYIDQPRIIHIPSVREPDARAMVADYLAGKRPLGADWIVTDGEARITNAVLWLSPNEYPEVAA